MDALTIDNLSFNYSPGIPVLRDIALSVHPGEFLSVVGPNGSGKSTFLKICGRIHAPDRGTVSLYGRSLSSIPRNELARRIGYVFQDHTVHFPFTVYEVVLMGRAPHTRGALFEGEEDHAIAMRMMEKTDIAHLATQAVSRLSGGERQRAFIARALAQQPEIMLLDEPNAHLDIAHQVEIFGLMKELNRESGLTVVAVSHDLNLAASYSDRIALLLCGGLVAVGSPDEVLTSNVIREVFRTDVLIDVHPVHGAPRITLTSGEPAHARAGEGSPATIGRES
jgi:iron complex transport system ATP-binding protein